MLILSGQLTITIGNIIKILISISARSKIAKHNKVHQERISVFIEFYFEYIDYKDSL